MDAITTLDFKTLLRDWRSYQKGKLEMANMFRCNSDFGCGGIRFEATLSFNTEGEYFLEVYDSGRKLVRRVRVMLAAINGYNVEGRNVTLIIKPELNEPNVILEFPTAEVLEVALSKLESFCGEMVGEPTPPSSSEND